MTSVGRWSRLAWSLWATAMVIGVLNLVFLALTTSSPRPQGFGFPGFSVILAIGFSTVGAVVASRKPGNPIGWLFLAVGLMSAVRGLAREYAVYVLGTKAEPLPGGAIGAWLDHWIWVPAVWLMITFLLLLFPNGHLSSKRWRPVAWTAALLIVLVSVGSATEPGRLFGFPSVVNPYGLSLPGPLALASFIGFIALLPAAMVCTASLIARYRTAGAGQRQQIKWLMLAGAFLGVMLPLGQAFGAAGDALTVAAMLAVPVAVGVAVLRYRLYDIDRIINRAVVYTIVVGVLAAAYVGAVFLVRQLLPQSSDLAVAGSTLAVAALFNPMRKSAQRFVDRRFYRSRYDAQRVVEEFAARLTDEIDLDTLAAYWVGVVNETVQPASVSVWMKSAD